MNEINGLFNSLPLPMIVKEKIAIASQTVIDVAQKSLQLVAASPNFILAQLYANKIEVFPNLLIQIPFFKWVQGNDSDNKIEDIIDFCNPDRLEREFIIEMRNAFKDMSFEDASLLFEHIQQLPQNKTIAMAELPRMHSELFFYESILHTSEQKTNSVSFPIPYDVYNSFNRMSYHLDSERVTRPYQSNQDNLKHIEEFCSLFELRLERKANEMLKNAESETQKCLANQFLTAIRVKIDLILAAVLRHACLDGMGSYIRLDDFARAKIAHNTPLFDKCRVDIVPDEKLTYINFELDDKGNLCISFSIINHLTINYNNETYRSKFHSSSVLCLILNLLSNNFHETNEATLFTLPYVPKK